MIILNRLVLSFLFVAANLQLAAAVDVTLQRRVQCAHAAALPFQQLIRERALNGATNSCIASSTPAS